MDRMKSYLTRCSVGVLLVALISGCMSSSPISYPKPPIPVPGAEPLPRMPGMSRSSKVGGRPSPSTQSTPSNQSPGNPSSSSSQSQGTPSTGRPSSSSQGTGSPMPSPSPAPPSSNSQSSSSQSGFPSSPSSSQSSSDSSISSPSSSSSSSSSSIQSSSGPDFPQIPGLPQPNSGDSDGNSDGEGSEGQTSTGKDSQGTPASGQDNSGQSGGEVPQSSGDESMEGSSQGQEQGVNIGGLPSSGAGEQDSGGQSAESDEDMTSDQVAGTETEAGSDGNNPTAGSDQGGTAGAGTLGSETNDQTDPGVPDPAQANGQPDSSEENIWGSNNPADDLWQTSNQIPTIQKKRGGSDDLSEEEGEGQSSSDENDQGNNPAVAQGEMDSEMAKVLGEIDGSILSDRTEQSNRENERAGGPTLPGDDVAENTSSSSDDGEGNGTVGGTSTAAIPNATDPRSSASRGNGIPTQVSGQDTPDAQDDDVIARQLREAAMAETDPKLREDLWEEYRRYTSKRK